MANHQGIQVFECVKCGFENTDGVSICDRCTWPFAKYQWMHTNHRIKALTIDTCCVNALGRDVNLNKIEQWEKKGYLRIQRAPALLEELKGEARRMKAKKTESQPDTFLLNGSSLGGGDVLAGPDMPETLKKILFPTAKSLTDNQEYDVKHLRAHVRVGGDVFVTINSKDFINNSKQVQLSRIGVWVFEPAEVVSLLGEVYEWV